MSELHYKTIRFRVRYSETDQMGVVYHTNYVNWLEVGRTEFLRDASVSYRELEAQGLLLPLTDVQVSYKSPARYDDVVEVRTWIEQITPVRLDFGYEVYRIEDVCMLVTGVTKHVFTNLQFTPVRLPKLLPDLYEWLLGQKRA